MRTKSLLTVLSLSAGILLFSVALDSNAQQTGAMANSPMSMPAGNMDMPARASGPMSASTQALEQNAANIRKNMRALGYPVDTGADFVVHATPQGAVDQAEVEPKYGKEPQMRAPARNIIKAQNAAIADTRAWQNATPVDATATVWSLTTPAKPTAEPNIPESLSLAGPMSASDLTDKTGVTANSQMSMSDGRMDTPAQSSDPKSASTQTFGENSANVMENLRTLGYPVDIGADFVAHTIPQGAVDQAELELKYGKDPQMRALARNIIAAQNETIADMRQLQDAAPDDAPDTALSSPTPAKRTAEPYTLELLGRASPISASGMMDKTERAMFIAQMDYETGGFRSLEESMKYKPKQFLRLFGKRLGITTEEQAQTIVNKGTGAIADAVYGGPWGAKNLGNIEPGDGLKFKGRGFTQLTGRANYVAAAKATGLDLVNHPELASNPANAAKIAVWFHRSRSGLVEVSRDGDVLAATKKINGGTMGLNARSTLFKRYLAATTIAPTAIATTQ